MGLINHEELKKQIASGELTSLDDITNEFKNILKEVIQTASQEELNTHLGYDKHQQSKNSNYRQDVLIFAIDGLNGFNEAIKAVYPKAEIQRCIVHQIRSSLD
jgi:transposase-like protein